MTHPVVGCMASQFDRQVYGIEIELVETRRRPKPALRVAPKQPDGEPSLFLFRFYEAAVRDLTDPAISGPSPTLSQSRQPLRLFDSKLEKGLEHLRCMASHRTVNVTR